MSSHLLATAGAVLLLMSSVWLLSVWRRDASVVDIFWGVGFAVIALVSYQIGGGYGPRARWIASLTVLWGVRLGAYLAWRNWGTGEDYRYQAMRRSIGERFWIVSLVTVFGLQGLLMWVISLPIQVAQAMPQPAQLTVFDFLGCVLWLIGFGFESIGDWQLARFKSDPANRGQVMDRGLWRYTRHPNYFGDALLWWGLFSIALPVPHGGWTIIGPLLMTGLLLRVSGVPLLEKKLVETRPEYADYIRRTSAFFPWPPKRA